MAQNLVNEHAENLQDMIHGDPVVNLILQASRVRWLTAAEWDLLFIEAQRFQIHNPTLIPNHSEGVWRIDNRWMLDLNEWVLSSLARTLCDGPFARFNIRLSVGNYFPGTNIRLHRRVVRRIFAEDTTTFVQYLYVYGGGI